MRTKRAFKVKYKAFLIIFKGLLVAKNCLRHDSGILKHPCISTIAKLGWIERYHHQNSFPGLLEPTVLVKSFDLALCFLHML